MARPCLKDSKHRREYLVMTFDNFFGTRRYFIRTGYKSLILKEFITRYPDLEISIYVLSSRVISNIK